MIYYYYCIENLKNNKKYCGITTNPQARKNKHFQELRNKYHHSDKLQKSFNKYGAENFEFRILEEHEFSSKIEAYLYEIEFIKKYDGYINGYNMTPGGEISPMLDENIAAKVKQANQERVDNVYQIDINTYKIINIYGSLREAERQTGIFRTNITKVCNRNDISAGGFYWCYEKDWSVNWLPPLNKKYKPIALIDKDSLELIKVFPSCAEAARQLNIDRSNIRSSINRNGKCNGYKFKYIDIETYELYACRD